jgi:predicted DNA-binding protein
VVIIYRININVSDDIKKLLVELSKKEGRNVSEIIREAIVKLLMERGYLKR